MNIIPKNSLFDMTDFFGNFYYPTLESDRDLDLFSPRVNINEKEDHYDITADLPGVDKKDLQVSLDGDVLTIEATTTKENEETDNGRVIRKERRSGKYVRRFTLGGKPNEEDIKASFNNGVLQLLVPKMDGKTAESKKITIL
ncbi:Hsp20/alpha crystallin family protein [Shewanella sp. A14]